MPKAITKPFINRASGLRRSLERQVATVSEASPTKSRLSESKDCLQALPSESDFNKVNVKKMKKYFNSNETLEMCDVKVAEDGRIEIQTKPYHAPELARLGKPEKTIRGRVVMEEGNLHFAPYAEASRKPTYSKQVVVGSTTLQCTEEKVKISFMVPRHLTKALMVMYIQSEIDEVKRRLETDVYDMLAKASNDNDNDNENCHSDGKVDAIVSVNVEEKGGDL